MDVGARLNRGDRRGENVRRRQRVRGRARQHNLVAHRVELRVGFLSRVSLLDREEQFVQGQVPRFFAGVGRDQKCAVRTNRNTAALRQRNVRAEIDRDFRGRHPQPEEDRFQGKGRNHFAAIAKKKRHMDSVRDFLRQIREAGRGDKPHFFAGLAADSRKLHQLAALPRHLSEARDFRTRRVRIGRRSQFRGEKQSRHPHGLIHQDLLLVLVPLAPFQNIFERDHGRLEFQNRLKEKRELEGRDDASTGMGRSFAVRLRRVLLHERVVADVDYRERRGGSVRVRIRQKPMEKKFFRLLQPRLAHEKNPEQQDDEHKPEGRSLHCRRSEEGKVPGDKWEKVRL